MAFTPDGSIPSQSASNLLIATWNVRAFGGLTQSWQARDADSPKRDWHAIACIAAIVSRFDVVAIQDTRRNTTALHALLDRLGPRWRCICSDVTEGTMGNGERLAYLYNLDRVQSSGLVGEIVLPPAITGPVEQFARTPYVASFERTGTEFILATVHVLWGKALANRLTELTAFAEWLRSWADRRDEWNKNLLVLGDFSTDRVDDPLYEAFLSTGLYPPIQLRDVPRTIFNGDKSGNFYDQIAWFSTPEGADMLHGLSYANGAGAFTSSDASTAT